WFGPKRSTNANRPAELPNMIPPKLKSSTSGGVKADDTRPCCGDRTHWASHVVIDTRATVASRTAAEASPGHPLVGFFCRAAGSGAHGGGECLAGALGRVRRRFRAKAHVSPNVRRESEEASQTLEASPRGAAALLRLTIEKLCKELGVSDESLKG